MAKKKRLESLEFITPSGQKFNPLQMSARVKEVIYNIADDLMENEEGINDWGEACICAFIIFLCETEGETPTPENLN
jgi:hypothetical protein